MERTLQTRCRNDSQYGDLTRPVAHEDYVEFNRHGSYRSLMKGVVFGQIVTNIQHIKAAFTMTRKLNLQKIRKETT
jgi:hypothetical protein